MVASFDIADSTQKEASKGWKRAGQELFEFLDLFRWRVLLARGFARVSARVIAISHPLNGDIVSSCQSYGTHCGTHPPLTLTTAVSPNSLER